MARTKQPEDGFEIYCSYSDNGKLIPVSDPLHKRILLELSESPLSTTEIAEHTGKAQSTLSVHLDAMVSRSLIKFEYDKNDSRRKIFSLTSFRVIGTKPPDEEGKKDFRKFIDEAVYGDSFYKNLIISLLILAETNGLDVSDSMRILGNKCAESLFREDGTLKIEDVIRAPQEFYEKHSLGEVCIYAFLPLTIIIRNAEEYIYKMSGLASFNHGMFETSITKATGATYTITKSEIFGTGNNYYKFIMEPVKDH